MDPHIDSESLMLPPTTAHIQRRALATHPCGQVHLDKVDEQLAFRVKLQTFVDGVMDPLFAWPLIAAVTQFVLG